MCILSEKHYKLEDLKIGMYVESEELRDIYGVYIYLDAYDNNLLHGKILHICEKPDEIAEEIRKKYGGLCCFHQSKEYLEEGVDMFESTECFSGELFHTLVFGDCSEEDLSDVSLSASNEEVSKGSFESASLGECLS